MAFFRANFFPSGDGWEAKTFFQTSNFGPRFTSGSGFRSVVHRFRRLEPDFGIFRSEPEQMSWNWKSKKKMPRFELSFKLEVYIPTPSVSWLRTKRLDHLKPIKIFLSFIKWSSFFIRLNLFACWASVLCWGANESFFRSAQDSSYSSSPSCWANCRLSCIV